MKTARTNTDVSAADEWVLADAPVRLRVWGTERVYELPRDTGGPGSEGGWTIGAAQGCWLRLEDPSGRVSRQHARLVREAGGWVVHDGKSKNGIRQDGERRASIAVVPGVEIGIGGVTLVAESPRLVALRGFVCRMLGWSPEQSAAVDLAVRAIRITASRRESLLLCGEGDLVAIALQLHRRALGGERPFVVCDPRRRNSEASVRVAESRTAGLPALEAARGGTLCVWAKRLPSDFDAVIEALREPSAAAQLVVCTPTTDDLTVTATVAIPKLAQRADEIDRIIVEYAADALAELEARSTSFLPEDRAWVRAHAAQSLPDIEKAVRRLVAIREYGNIHKAASRLGMSRVALAEWVGARSR